MGEPAALFGSDSNGNGMPDGLDYAFGGNLATNELPLKILLHGGHVVVDAARQDDATLPYADVTVRGCTNLPCAPADWTLPVEPAGDTTGKPANRAWYEPTGTLERAFFRLDAILK